MNKEKHVISIYNIQWCGEENENNRKTCHQPSGSGHEAPYRSSFRAVALAGHRNENPGRNTSLWRRYYEPHSLF